MSCHIIRTAWRLLCHSSCFWFLLPEPEEWGVFLPSSEGLNLLCRSWLLKSCHLLLLCACLRGWGRDESLQLSSWVKSDSKKERWKALICIMQASALVWNTTQGVAMCFSLIRGHQTSLPMLATPECPHSWTSTVPGIIPSPHANIQESKVFSCEGIAYELGPQVIDSCVNLVLCTFGSLWHQGWLSYTEQDLGKCTWKRSCSRNISVNSSGSRRDWFQKHSSPCCQARDRCHFSTPLYPVLLMSPEASLPQRYAQNITAFTWL